ncbi:protein kinase domain-containing protein [Rhodococcus sp. ACT016]|uniref:protein kinase domain-containing protein n=1 Tax=Rhodococcus sp. ACT016 TaxID=3134808 RepID=UPI003D2DEA8C
MGADEEVTRRGSGGTIAAELAAEGFEDACEVGRGGYGVVYRCTEAALERTVAVKVSTAGFDETSRARFVREQRALGRLSGHPNVVEVLQVGVTTTGSPFIVMPYHKEGSLDARIRRYGPLTWQETVRIGVKLSDALAAAHQLGILHRDVKPANILVTRFGEPQLSDFGVARMRGAFETQGMDAAGTPAFTAPEVMLGTPASISSDVYGLGSTLFYCLTGHAAFSRRTGESVNRQLRRLASEPIPDLRPRGIPDEVCIALEHATSPDPDRRPESAAAFGELLRATVSDSWIDRPDSPSRPLTLSGPLGPTPRSGTTPLPPVARTRFHPPDTARTFVDRDRLIRSLAGGRGRLLTLIHAPAGFGKTVLASQWRSVLVSEGMPVAWLSVNADDNNVVWFLAHFTEAIGQVRPDLTKDLGQALEEYGDEAVRFVLTTLVNLVHDRDEAIAVVIDDWHLVTDQSTIEAIEFLLDNACHHLQLIVTSRTPSGLPLSRMRVRGELVEVGQDEIRFDAEETRQFLDELGDVHLGDHDVLALRDTTDGWAAALQLASLSLRDADDPTDVISHMSGRSRAIGEYLAENVLNALEPSILEFLITTCIAERVSGSLASRLAGVPNGQALLEDVEDRDLFLRAVDDERTWFRYHHLFAEYLRRRLERDYPGRAQELHGTASRWFADHGMVREAVDHALEAGEPDLAADLVEAKGMQLVENAQMSSLLGLIDKLPAPLADSRPRLLIIEAWGHVLLHHTSESVESLLRRAEDGLHQQPADDCARDDLLAEAMMLQGVVGVFADRIEHLAEGAAHCFARADTLRPFVLAGAANNASFEALHSFDFHGARMFQEKAAPQHDSTLGPLVVVYGYCFAAFAAREQLDYPAADDLCQRALHRAKQHSVHSHVARLAGALLGSLLYERDRVEEAETLLDECHELGSEGGAVDFMLLTYGLGARVKALRGDMDGARARLDEGAQIARTLELPRLAARVENERVRCGFASHPDGTASLPDGTGNGIAIATADLHEDSTIQVLLRNPSPPDADTARDLARERLERIRQQERPLALLRAELLYALCLHTAGNPDDAFLEVVPPLTRCAPFGLVRTVLDTGPGMKDLLTALRAGGQDGDRVPSSFLDAVLAADTRPS